MTRLLAKAALMSVLAAAALVQLESGRELLVWELILLAIVIWEMRGLPGAVPGEDRALFDVTPREPYRLPRAVSTIELNVIDAISGHVEPERRLQPVLRRIATHRLGRGGLDLESPAAPAALGDEAWSWLAEPAREPPSVEALETLVSRLEGL